MLICCDQSNFEFQYDIHNEPYAAICMECYQEHPIMNNSQGGFGYHLKRPDRDLVKFDLKNKYFEEAVLTKIIEAPENQRAIIETENIEKIVSIIRDEYIQYQYILFKNPKLKISPKYFAYMRLLAYNVDVECPLKTHNSIKRCANVYLLLQPLVEGQTTI